jgi:hypothetical protein
MFNPTIYNNESKVVAVTKEIEKTITPDKVTEMYDAVRNEVENSIIRSIVVADNSLHGSAMEIVNQFHTMSHLLLLRFTLNGKEYIAKETTKKEDEMDDNKLYEHLREFYMRTVADNVMRDTINVGIRTIHPHRSSN